MPSRASGAVPSLALPGGEAHLHRLDAEVEVDDAVLATYTRWLSPEESARLASLSLPQVAREYLLTRAFVRATLSRYVPGVVPSAWRFVANEHGRPEIASPAVPFPLRFNLSHTYGLIACLVVLGRDAGVDVEDGTRPGRTVAVADRFFATSEVVELVGQPEARQRERFFEYWTLKEAYIKARGMGLAIPLGKFAFRLPREVVPARGEVGPGIVSIDVDPSLGDDAVSWQFTQARPNERHYLATAIRVAPGERVTIVDHQVDAAGLHTLP